MIREVTCSHCGKTFSIVFEVLEKSYFIVEVVCPYCHKKNKFEVTIVIRRDDV